MSDTVRAVRTVSFWRTVSDTVRAGAVAWLAAMALFVASCGAGDVATDAVATPVAVDDALYPDIVAVEAAADGASWRFSVTVSSPYDTPARYADAWRVLDASDNELGIRVLLHDHQTEQPFTRSLSGVTIDESVDVVYIEGRDQLNGWSGQRFEVRLVR